MRILIVLPFVAILAGAGCSPSSESTPAPKEQPAPDAGKTATTTTDFVLERVP